MGCLSGFVGETGTLSAEPTFEIPRHKIVVAEVGIGSANAVNLLDLAWRSRLVGIQAPAAFQESLATQNLVQACDASRKIVSRIEESGIRICDFSGTGE